MKEFDREVKQEVWERPSQHTGDMPRRIHHALYAR